MADNARGLIAFTVWLTRASAYRTRAASRSLGGGLDKELSPRVPRSPEWIILSAWSRGCQRQRRASPNDERIRASLVWTSKLAKTICSCKGNWGRNGALKGEPGSARSVTVSHGVFTLANWMSCPISVSRGENPFASRTFSGMRSVKETPTGSA